MTDAPDLLERLRSALADRYELEGELGAGGMAIVFLARDIKHDRQVAVKVFRPELASSLGTERFLREIKIAAKLSHPHILPLYDSGEAAGFLYYIMPLVEGESLADRMEREKMLPFEDALQIAREVADALNYAHARGLVHRDIKPDNIMLTGGHAVVMDFGIARAVNAAGGDKLTQTGMAVGTPLYMSPEQGMAVEEVDGRSDIYALGCVLYEMLTGTPPFTGPTPQAVMARHTMDQVPSPAIIRDTISPELEDIIMCALAKAPADRFRTAGDFGEALKVIHTGTGTMPRFSVSMARPSRAVTRETLTTPLPFSPRRAPKSTVAAVSVLVAGAMIYFFGIRTSGPSDFGGLDPTSIAVLYFKDLSADGSLGYVADAITEGLIRQLSSVQELDVISRDGVERYRDIDVTPDSIGRALDVGSVIRGSVEPEGDGLRVSAQLLEGGSGASIQRASFVLPATDLLAVMDSAAYEVSRILREWIGTEVRLRQQRASTASTEAWALAQRGERLRKEADEFATHDDLERAVLAYRQADSILTISAAADPRWVEPIVLRGQIMLDRAALAHDPDEQDAWVDQGLNLAEQALALDASDAKALELRGRLRYYSWRYGPDPEPEEAERLLMGATEDLQAAVTADETLASAFDMLSLVHSMRGNRLDANLWAMKAYEADAYLRNVDGTLWRLYQTSYDTENFSAAINWCDEIAERFPEGDDAIACRLWLMTTRAVEPDVDEAWRLMGEMEKLLPATGRPEYYRSEAQMLVAAALAGAGLVDSADQVLIRARGNPEIDPARALVTLEGFIRTLMGDTDEALRLLQSYYAFNPHHRHEDAEDVHWWWRDLQDDPRYQALMREGR